MENDGLLREMLSFRSVRTIWQYRELLSQLIRRNIQMRYNGTILGVFWMFATPLLMLAVYTFVFSVVFKVRWGTEEDTPRTAFALILFCGLSVFNLFSESLTTSSVVITSNQNYVKKVVFPLEILPVSMLLTSMFFMLFWFAILLVGILVFMQTATLTMLAFPLVLLPLVLFTCGASWLLASLGVYFRDLPHALGIVLQILFFMTPIFYSLEMIPERFRTFMYLNPITSVVENVRGVLIYGLWPNWITLGVQTAVGLAAFSLGYAWFMKTKRGFSDVL